MTSLLPGWAPAPFKGSLLEIVLNTISKVLDSSSTAATIAFPSGIQAGDLIVLYDRAHSAFATPADVTPTGFTRIGSSVTVAAASPTFVGARSNLWYKLAAGTETGNLTGMNGNALNGKAMAVFRGNIAATSITVGGANQTGTDGNPGALTCAANAGNAPLVVIGAYSSTGAISPRIFSTTPDAEILPATTLYLAYKIYNSSPASTDIDMDDEGNTNIVHCGYLEMA